MRLRFTLARSCAALSLTLALAAPALAVETLTVDAANVISKHDRLKLLGVPLLNFGPYVDMLADHSLTYDLLNDLRPWAVRLPGGSYADICIWNDENTLDRLIVPQFEFGANLAPGTLLHITVNGGYGCGSDEEGSDLAAAWVDWAFTHDYDTAIYWEIGNELMGGHENGHSDPVYGLLTGDKYGARARMYIEKMKAKAALHGKTIKVGGPSGGPTKGDFARGLLEHAGNLVDYLSYHPFAGDAVNWDRAYNGSVIAQGARELIQEYVDNGALSAEHAAEMEVGYTAWSMQLNPKPNEMPQLTDGIWTTIWISEMFKGGVDWTIIFDQVSGSVGYNGGHGMFAVKDDLYIPRSKYWAMYLWANCMADEMVSADITRGALEQMGAWATKDDDNLYVMLANHDKFVNVEARLALSGFSAADVADVITLSWREYFWDLDRGYPEWDSGPRVETINATGAASGEMRVNSPPYSIRVYRIPRAGSAAETQLQAHPHSARPPVGRPVLAFDRCADIVTAGSVVTGMLRVFERGTLANYSAAMKTNAPDAYPQPLPDAQLRVVSGPATLRSGAVRLAEAAGAFELVSTGVGTVTLEASIPGRPSSTVRKTIHVTNRSMGPRVIVK